MHSLPSGLTSCCLLCVNNACMHADCTHINMVWCGITHITLHIPTHMLCIRCACIALVHVLQVAAEC